MKTKNKLLTLLILSSSAITSTALINKLIKIKAIKDNISDTQETYCYSWRLGDIFYTKTGTGKPILLIHDLNAASSIHEWSQLIPLLSKNYTVYAMDLLGCGKSEKVNTTYTNYLYVQLISDFIKSEIGHRVNIIATGESASVSIMACSNNPELFDQMMLLNPLSFSECCKIPGKRARLYKKIIELPIIGTLLYNIAISKSSIEEEMKKNYFYNPNYIKSSIINSYHKAAHLGFSPKSMYASQKCNYTKCNIINAIKKIDNSIYLVGGEEINNILTRLNEYKTYNPAVEIFLIPKTKYLPQLENPILLNEIIQTYFR